MCTGTLWADSQNTVSRQGGACDDCVQEHWYTLAIKGPCILLA